MDITQYIIILLFHELICSVWFFIFIYLDKVT